MGHTLQPTASYLRARFQVKEIRIFLPPSRPLVRLRHGCAVKKTGRSAHLLIIHAISYNTKEIYSSVNKEKAI
jgi:hypothetical protein